MDGLLVIQNLSHSTHGVVELVVQASTDNCFHDFKHHILRLTIATFSFHACRTSYANMNESEPQLRSVADQKSKRIDPNLHASPRSARTGQWYGLRSKRLSILQYRLTHGRTADGTCIVQTTPNNTIETIVLFVSLYSCV
jgi:hypothetical protein